MKPYSNRAGGITIQGKIEKIYLHYKMSNEEERTAIESNHEESIQTAERLAKEESGQGSNNRPER